MKSPSELGEIPIETQNNTRKWYKNPNIWTIIIIVLLVLAVIILTTILFIKKNSHKSRILADYQ
jgi:hypothetical protein